MVRIPQRSWVFFSLLVLVGLLGAVSCGPEDRKTDDGSASGDGDSAGGQASSSGGIGGADPKGDGGAPTSTGGESMGGTAGATGCIDLIPIRTEAPEKLSETGLYSEIGTKTVAPHVRLFEPKFKLWSDGAEKMRWLFLPACGSGQIDSSTMDSWDFPVGTYAFKQFALDDVLIETRMIHRFGPDPQEWLYATYVWNEEGTDAILDNNGATITRADGPDYSVPSVVAGHCARCHGPNSPGDLESRFGMPSRLLGVNAIDLSHDGPGLTISELSEEGSLSVLAPEGFSPPGSETEVAALGYLHANCGYCHNDTPLGQVVFETNYFLRLKTTDTTLEETGTYATAVNQPVTGYFSQEDVPCTHRVHGDDATLSCIYERMGLRGAGQMPLLDTNRQDEDGMAVIEAWIATLPAPE